MLRLACSPLAWHVAFRFFSPRLRQAAIDQTKVYGEESRKTQAQNAQNQAELSKHKDDLARVRQARPARGGSEANLTRGRARRLAGRRSGPVSQLPNSA